METKNTLASIGLKYPIIVNYDLDLKTAIAKGNYGWNSHHLTQRCFANKRHGQSKLEIEIFLLIEDRERTIGIDHAINELKKISYRPANIRELLALGEQYPDAQKSGNIVAFESIWTSIFGIIHCPVIGFEDSLRSIRAYENIDDDWGGFRVAAIRE